MEDLKELLFGSKIFDKTKIEERDDKEETVDRPLTD